MASLTHVCVWSGNGWKRITAEEAAKVHPGGTFSAHSGLFMWELCGQYVLLTDGKQRVRYFKHSSHEKNKDCPERKSGANVWASYNSEEHNLPIRIIKINPLSFQFELGLIRAPIGTLGNNFRIEIKLKGFDGESFIYSKERLNSDKITYLSIGEKPAETYYLSLYNGTEKLQAFWPAEIKGIDPKGTLFEGESRKMLPYDSDVEINKEYYLLKRGYPYYGKLNSGLISHEVSRMRVAGNIWYLYSVCATEFNENTARFFLDYHCRLTEHPIILQPVWPLFGEGSYLIRHNQRKLVLLIKGNVSSVKTFPIAPIRKLSREPSYPMIYEVNCSDRQQLISAGRTKALQYTYFWKEPIGTKVPVPKVMVTDILGNSVGPGKTDILPKEGILRFDSPYDGQLIIGHRGRTLEKHKILANHILEVDSITWDINIQFYIGLDCLWEILYQKECISNSAEYEMEILKYIACGNRRMIPAPHSLRNIAISLKEYPKISEWIKRCIKKKRIDEQSYRRLQLVYRKVKKSEEVHYGLYGYSL